MRCPTGGATLYVLAHHDDEVFCAGRLWADLAAGREPRLLWATAGGLAPARRRRLEGRRVARLLGLTPGTAVSLGWPDQAAADHLPAILEAAVWLAALGEGAAQRKPVDAVCVPAFEGGHPDHDAVNVVADVLRERWPQLRVEEFAMYRRSRRGVAVKAAWPGARAAALAPPARALRRRLMTANASQLPSSLAPLAALAAARGTWQTEPWRALPGHDYGRPPLGGRPLYEMYTRWEFGRFAAAVAAFGGEA